MLRQFAIGGAMLVAIPALAQTAGSTGQQTANPAPTTTNDHDPTETPADAGRPAAAPPIGSQVNGGVMSGSPGAPPAARSASSYGGVGGPIEGARIYPRCSRMVRDNCIQGSGRRR